MALIFFPPSSLAGWIFRQVKKLSLLAGVTEFFGNEVLSFIVLALRIRFCRFSIYFVSCIFFSAFIYLIYFLVFCLAFRFDRSFVNRYFAIDIRLQFLVFPCFLSLFFFLFFSLGRAASSERTIAIIMCMFCGPFVFAHGCYMTREFTRELHLLKQLQNDA